MQAGAVKESLIYICTLRYLEIMIICWLSAWNMSMLNKRGWRSWIKIFKSCRIPNLILIYDEKTRSCQHGDMELILIFFKNSSVNLVKFKAEDQDIYSEFFLGGSSITLLY